MKNTNLLIKEPPLLVLPSLAAKIGLNEAIIIQQLHYWLENPKAGVERDGHKWIFNTYEEWVENFPFWSVSTIQRIFTGLEKSGLIISAQLDAKQRDMKKYYRINYDELCKMQDSNLTSSSVSTRHDVNNESETTTNKDISPIKKDEVLTAMQQAGMYPNSTTPQLLAEWRKVHSDEWIIKAIERSKGKNQNYADKILLGWEAEGYPKPRAELVTERKQYAPVIDVSTNPAYQPYKPEEGNYVPRPANIKRPNIANRP